MTTATFVMPLLGRKKDVVKTTGVANSALISAVVPPDHIGILIDEAVINLATIHSGLLVPALEELRDNLIAKSALYTTIPAEECFVSGTDHANPKLQAYQEFVAASLAIQTVLQLASGTVVLIMSTNDGVDPNIPTNRDTGIGFIAAQYIADYIRESLK